VSRRECALARKEGEAESEAGGVSAVRVTCRPYARLRWKRSKLCALTDTVHDKA